MLDFGDKRSSRAAAREERACIELSGTLHGSRFAIRGSPNGALLARSCRTVGQKHLQGERVWQEPPCSAIRPRTMVPERREALLEYAYCILFIALDMFYCYCGSSRYGRSAGALQTASDRLIAGRT